MTAVFSSFMYIRKSSHLVVPAAPGVQALSCVADAVDKQAFDIHMNILVMGRRRTFPASISAKNALESLDNLFLPRGPHNSCFPNIFCVSYAAGNILLIKTGVKGDGGMESPANASVFLPKRPPIILPYTFPFCLLNSA